MQATLLHDNWTFRNASEGVGYWRPNQPANPWRPAVVPGHIHDDLVRAGVIPDPFVLEHEAGCQWVSEEDWEYKTTFDWKPDPSKPRRILQFEGLDTVCRIKLNGEEIARHDNMFLPLEVDVTEKLQTGANELSIVFESPVRVGTERRKAYFEKNGVDHGTNWFDERSFVRKVQCMSGWDWGPRLVSCGLWQPVKLLEFEARIRSFTVFQEALPDGRFRVWSETVVEGSKGDIWHPSGVRNPSDAEPRVAPERDPGLPSSTPSGSVKVFPEGETEGSRGLSNSDTPESSEISRQHPKGVPDALPRLVTEFDGEGFDGDFDLVVEHPKLWWPNGEGMPHLYTAKASLSTGHAIEKKIGLRTVRLVQEPDEKGTSFFFEVNGRPIYARGANWIPNDSFPSRIAHRDYHDQIQTCAKLNMNMLRVWGGGLYEQDGFYDACDEVGILVWQDFPFACSYYPDGEEERNVLEKEVDHQIRRLRDRASLAIWCGNNENDVMWEGKWGGTELSPARYFGDCLYGDTLAKDCAQLDPNRAYVRSSPIGGQEGGKAWGDAHYWDVWHGRGDWGYYADSLTRFSSEFGFCSACTPMCWSRACVDTSRASQDDLPVRWHDKTNKPWEIYRSLVELHYPSSTALEDWIYFSQLNQRDALRFGIEHYRTNGYCMGTLIWQFNDCWPVQSWAVQDYSRRLKVAGFEMERLYAPVLISLEVASEEVVVRAANDGPEPFDGVFSVDFWTVDRHRLGTFENRLSLRPGGRIEVARLSVKDLKKDATVVSGEFLGMEGTRTWRTLDEPKHMKWEPAELSLSSALELKVEGLLYDAVFEDADRPGNVRLARQDLAGSPAVTVVNGVVRLEAQEPVHRIRVRSLAGIQMLTV